MEEQSEKMKNISCKRRQLLVERDELFNKFSAVEKLRVEKPNGDAARTQAMDALKTLLDEMNAKITSLEEEFEVAIVEHLSGLTFPGLAAEE